MAHNRFIHPTLHYRSLLSFALGYTIQHLYIAMTYGDFAATRAQLLVTVALT
jgi:hypothetical protein